ncbi:UbiA family prenyltransferase, partial [Streptomyces niveus]|uniref:UbiA family prenyltransferase n=1 Tax=Streptomyces niveus TaxID=193462 RepID=UPI0033EC0141
MRLRAWAELLRVSALFTVPGDALAGAASAGVRPNRGTALAVGASLCLYEAGMALNDWADRDEDARERPHRPIPSGRVTPNAALTAAGALTATGLFLASRAGRPTLALSTALAATVWAYDLRLKHTAAGPVAMGAARALDVLMGATATHAATRRTPIRPSPPPRGSTAGDGGTVVGMLTGSVDRPVVAATSPRRGVLARLSAWANGPAGRGSSTPPVAGFAVKLAGSASRPVSEAAASTARFSSPPAGRDVLARLSAWADGSDGQDRSTPGENLAVKLNGSARRRASEAAASTARFSSRPAGQDVPARMSAWAGGPGSVDGLVSPGRTTIRAGGPVEPLASRSAGAAGGQRAAVPRSALRTRQRRRREPDHALYGARPVHPQ